MSEIRENIDGIIEVASDKFLELMTESSQNIMEGKEGVRQYRKAKKILTLLKAYRKNADMETDEVDAILYCLLDLSEADELPTIPGILNEINFQFPQSTTVDLIIQNSSVDLPVRERLNFRNGLQASDDGSIIHAEFIGGEYDRLALVTTSSPIAMDMDSRKKRFFVGGNINGLRTWSTIANITAAMEFLVVFTITGLTPGATTHDQTMPADWMMDNQDGRWQGGQKWRPDNDGKYFGWGVYDGTNWIVQIKGINVLNP